MEKKIEYIKKAVAEFHDATGLKVEYLPQPGDEGTQAEGVIRLTYQGTAWRFLVEAHPRVTRETAALIKHDKGADREKRLIVARHVPEPVADLLRELDLFFMDAAGNAYVAQPPLYIFIKGNRLKEKALPPIKGRLFRPGGLRIIFILLIAPEMLNRTYREIAAAAGVALGTVGGCMENLKKAGYLIEQERGKRRLVNVGTLLKRWVEAYPEQLRPKLARDRFETDRQQWWQDVQITDFGAEWGAEIAAAHLTGLLKPAKAVIYTDAPLEQLVFKNRLRKTPNGPVEVLTPFWHCDHELAGQGVVPPLLIYADLLATGDLRNIETAKVIHERYLAGLVR